MQRMQLPFRRNESFVPKWNEYSEKRIKNDDNPGCHRVLPLRSPHLPCTWVDLLLSQPGLPLSMLPWHLKCRTSRGISSISSFDIPNTFVSCSSCPPTRLVSSKRMTDLGHWHVSIIQIVVPIFLFATQYDCHRYRTTWIQSCSLFI